MLVTHRSILRKNAPQLELDERRSSLIHTDTGNPTFSIDRCKGLLSYYLVNQTPSTTVGSDFSFDDGKTVDW
jgi:hypothetical protein